MANKKSSSDLSKEIKDLGSEARKQLEDDSAENIYIKPTDEDTRQKIAKLFVIVYFVLLGAIIVGVPLYNFAAYKATLSESTLQIKLNDVIQTYSAVVGPTLGFVIAYYFKSRNEK